MPPTRVSEYRDVGTLYLDPKNYRLPRDLDLEDDKALAAYLEQHYDLDEVAQSIAEEGFRPEEPLIAIEEDGRLLVAEGNRRLASLKLLLYREYQEALGGRRQTKWEQWAEIANQNASAGQWDLRQVPVVVYETRDQIAGSLGFRHVSGIAPWNAESKARYIADLVDGGSSFTDVARKIGSKADYVRRQYVAHRALVEARDARGVDTARAERYFGVYYRSLSNPANRSFAGLIDWSQQLDPEALNSVFRDDGSSFATYLSLLFGQPDQGESPVITDSRQLNDLGRVLENERAAQVLVSERDLDAALDVLGGDKSTVFNDLREALRRLRRANGAAWEFSRDDELLSMADRCQRTAERIVAQLKGAESPVE